MDHFPSRGHCRRRVAIAAAFLAGLTQAAEARGAPAGALTVWAHTGGAVRGVVASGGRGWIGEGSGVSVLDISDPNSLRRVYHAALASGADIHSLARRDDVIYAGAADGVHVLRITAGGNALTEESVVATPGTVRGLATKGDNLLISDAAFGLLGASLEVPGHPSVAWGVEVEGGAPGPVAVAGDLVLVPGSEVVVVRVPAAGPPLVLAAVGLGSAVVGVAARGTDAWAALATGEVVGLDLRRPWEPTVRGALAGMPPGRLADLPPYLLLLGDLRLLDVSRPGQPRDVFSGAGPYASLVPTVAVALEAKSMLAARGVGLDAVALADPMTPVTLGNYGSVWPVSDLAVGGLTAWVAKGTPGLDVLDLAAAGAPPTVVSYRPPGGVWSVVVRGADAYVTTGLGAQVLDITLPTSPVVKGTFGADWPPTAALAADGERVVAADGRQILVAAVEPGGPVARGQLAYDVLPDWPPAAVVSGVAVGPGAAYLAAGVAGIAVFDIGDAAAPRPRGFVTPGGAVLAVAYEAGRLVAGLADGLAVFEAAEPLAPTPRDFIRLGAPVMDVAISSRFACAALDSGGLVLVDVSVLGRARVVARRVPGAPVESCAVAGDRVVASSAGVLVMKWDPLATVSPPSPPAPQPTAPPRVPSATPGPTATAVSARPTAIEPTAAGGLRAAWLPWVRTGERR